MLQHIAPKPLIEPEQLKSEADWIEAGRGVFYEPDNLHLRTLDPKFITAARTRETFEKSMPSPCRSARSSGCAGYPQRTAWHFHFQTASTVICSASSITL